MEMATHVMSTIKMRQLNAEFSRTECERKIWSKASHLFKASTIFTKENVSCDLYFNTITHVRFRCDPHCYTTVQVPLLYQQNSQYSHFNKSISPYSQVLLKHCPIYHDIACGTVITVAKSESDHRIIAYTRYLGLTGELWGVCCEDVGEYWPYYKGTAL